MSRSSRTTAVVLGGLSLGALTIAGTSYLLSLLPEPDARAPAAEETSFLAHLLLPLSVVLGLVVAIVVVGALVRVLSALARSRGGDS